MSVEAKTKDNDYEVGYGRPPHHSRFKKGQSGNPTGRRRYTDSERGRQLLRQEANRLVTVRDDIDLPVITAFRLLAAKLKARHPILLKDTLRRNDEDRMTNDEGSTNQQITKAGSISSC